jgi:hypothetical protein
LTLWARVFKLKLVDNIKSLKYSKIWVSIPTATDPIVRRHKMKEITNRSALIVLPKDPYIEWAKLYNEELNEDLENRLKEKHVYLIDWTHDEDIIDVLEPYYLKIFEYELLSWNGYKSEWPQNRSWELFREWFEINLCDELIDLETEKIMSEKLQTD